MNSCMANIANLSLHRLDVLLGWWVVRAVTPRKTANKKAARG